MSSFGRIVFGAVCLGLLLAPAAQAHKLTAKRAEAALKPAAEQMTPEVAPKIVALFPGATVSKTSVDCRVAKKGHRADCSIDFSVSGGSADQTTCSRPASVAFRSKKSKALKVSIAPVLACLSLVSLE